MLILALEHEIESKGKEGDPKRHKEAGGRRMYEGWFDQ